MIVFLCAWSYSVVHVSFSNIATVIIDGSWSYELNGELGLHNNNYVAEGSCISLVLSVNWL